MNPGKMHKIKNLYYLVICPVIIFLGMEWFLRNPFQEKWGIKAILIPVNLLFFYLAEFIILSVTGSLKASLIILSACSLLWGVTDYYLYRFRGNTIVPWDFYSIKTALSVLDNYSFHPEARFIILSVLFTIFIITLIFCDYSIRSKHKLRITLLIMSLFLLFFALIPFVQNEKNIKTLRIYNKLFTPTTMSMRDGIVFAFVYDMQFLKVKKPQGYDSDGIKEVLNSKYGSDAPSFTAGPDTPNIIVIVCEAFSDPKVLTEFNTNEDYMSFIRNLSEDENCISGNLHVSVLGGNTPNTEFEFLTGHSMAFLPANSIPFLQFIRSETPSLPSYLKKRGYNTSAIHPYNASGWNRDRVYPLLGFDEMMFSDDFMGKDPKYVRKYISDETLFNEIIEKYKENGSETPFFSYNLTMQNHSDYTGEYQNFKPDIEIKGINERKQINDYLSLEKITDNAFKDLISYFESISDPTVVVFFGDHQPSNVVVSPLYGLNGRKIKDLSTSELRDRYKVPFIIWANYDIEEKKNLDISANFLSNLVLEAANIDISGYRAFLKDQYSKTPVVTAIHTVDSSGSDTDNDIEDPALKDYRMYQYYVLFE